MRFEKNMSIKFSMLALVFGLSAQAFANQPEKYSATVEDGTPKVLKANTSVDEDSSEVISEETVTRKVVRAPKLKKPVARKVEVSVEERTDEVAEQKSDAKADALADLKRQNEALEKRLASLEKAKAEAREKAAAEAADATEEEAQANDVAKNASSEDREEISAEAMVPAAPAAPAAKVAVKPAKPTSSSFDEVPGTHVTEIAQRLKYTNEILKRFGRAYDYRTTTLKEFKTILTELEASQEKSKALN